MGRLLTDGDVVVVVVDMWVTRSAAEGYPHIHNRVFTGWQARGQDISARGDLGLVYGPAVGFEEHG